MKRLFKKITLIMASLLVACSFGFGVVGASADEVTENTETTTETGVNSNDTTIDEEEPKKEETTQNDTEKTDILESEENTFESFLAWVEKEAERYGYQDEYAQALETIKTAASTKQVTLSTIATVAMLVTFLVYVVYKKFANGKTLRQANELVRQAKEQAKKLNELVDATNDNSKAEEEVEKEVAKLKEEMKLTLSSLHDFINGFMHFADGIKFNETKKDEVMRDCNNALKKIDGEVNGNENKQV